MGREAGIADPLSTITYREVLIKKSVDRVSLLLVSLSNDSAEGNFFERVLIGNV